MGQITPKTNMKFSRLLEEVAHIVDKATQVEPAIEQVLEKICKFIGWSVGHAYLPKNTPNGLLLVSTGAWYFKDSKRFATFKRVTDEMIFTLGVGLPGGVLASAKPSWIEDVTKKGALHRLTGLKTSAVKSGFALPILVGKEVVAVFEFFNVRKTKSNPKLMRQLMSIGTQIARLLERKQVEQIILTRESRFNAVFESALVGIFFADFATGAVIEANETFLKMVKYSQDDVSHGRVSLNELVPPQYTGRTNDIVTRLKIRDVYTPFEMELVCRDGSRVPTMIGVTKLKVTPERMMVFVLDLTERRMAEKIVEEHKLKLTAASRLTALGEMSGGIAHEINNPLAIIHARAGQIRDLVSDGGQVDLAFIGTLAEKIENTTMRISKIIKGLKTFARDGESDPFETVELKTLIHETLELCMERFKHHSVNLDVRLPTNPMRVECRSTQIMQVLLNLLNNAHDAVERASEKKIVLEVRDLGNEVDFIVSDTGSGVPAELREKIMQPFFTTKEVGRGTGLGLSISKGIIENHQGTLWLDTSAKITTFRLRIPKSQRALAAA
jgi:PAS domain S-box-containing protein